MASLSPEKLSNGKNNIDSKKSAIRHAEKRRTSTCLFADRIAQAALAVYRRVVLVEQDQQQEHRKVEENDFTPTCIAAILIHEASSDTLTVLALGVGTKFLTQDVLQQEQDNDSVTYGRRVRDLHAEVLCRRAFRRYLLECMLQDLKKKKTNKSKTASYHSTATAAADFMEWHSQQHQWSIRPGYTFHAYFSSTPCGNATLKKFAKLSKEVFRPSLKQWPTERHEPQPGHSVHLGQFALLLKKDATAIRKNDNNDDPRNNQVDDATTTTATAATTEQLSNSGKPQKQQQQQQQRNGRRVFIPPENIPMGTTVVEANDGAAAPSAGGSLHTCSDKVCRWNCLGWQGSLLASLLTEPLHMQSITVGRKFSSVCLRRAVCCRIAADCSSEDVAKKSTSKKKNNISAQQQRQSLFRVHHPAVMCTAVYVDPDTAVPTNNDNGEKNNNGNGDENNNNEHSTSMRFTSNRGYCWWPNTTSTETPFSTAHVIDGSTGFAIVNSKGDDSEEEESPVCTKQLTQIYQSIQQELDRLSVDNSTDGSNHESSNDSSSITHQSTTLPLRLEDLRRFKEHVSPEYEKSKADLFRHMVMRSWKRRWPSQG